MKAHPDNLGTAFVVQPSPRRFQVAIAYTIVDGVLVLGFDGPSFKNRNLAIVRANEINARKAKP